MLSAKPISEYAVDVEFVFATRIDQLEPPSVDLSILYPVIGEPPSSTGAFQLRSICDEEVDVADRFVGGCGTAGGGVSSAE